jgi:hypothetical protein
MGGRPYSGWIIGFRAPLFVPLPTTFGAVPQRVRRSRIVRDAILGQAWVWDITGASTGDRPVHQGLGLAARLCSH